MAAARVFYPDSPESVYKYLDIMQVSIDARVSRETIYFRSRPTPFVKECCIEIVETFEEFVQNLQHHHGMANFVSFSMRL